jgi:hypothetical protein
VATPQGRRVFTGGRVHVHFDMNRKGIAGIAMGPELAASVMEVAEQTALPYAVSISPRSGRTDKIHYQDSFVVVPGTAWIVAMRRVAARLYNLAPHAIVVEVGTDKTPAHRVLGKTLDHLNSLGHDHN